MREFWMKDYMTAKERLNFKKARYFKFWKK